MDIFTAIRVTTRPQPKTKIVLVARDWAQLTGTAGDLTRAGFEVHTCRDSADALRFAALYAPQVAILDSMVANGAADLCHRLRLGGTQAIMMLTPPGDPQAIIAGLDAGADDCLAQPVAPLELVARVNALVRRLAPVYSAL